MSTRYNTGNPIESTDVRDMSDNAKNLDLFSNSSDMAFDDRFGVERKTIHGMNSEFNSQILNMGFTRIGTFASGATLANPRQTLLWDVANGGDGQEYGWSGTFPKIVHPSSTPSSTGGIAVGAWISRFDPELQIIVFEALRRTYAEAGYNLIGMFSNTGLVVTTVTNVVLWEPTGVAYSYSGTLPHTIADNETPIGNPSWVDRSHAAISFQQAGTGAVPRTAKDKMREVVSLEDFGGVGDGVADDTAAFSNAVAKGQPFHLDGSKTYCLDGASASAAFANMVGIRIYGNGATIRVKGGDWGIKSPIMSGFQDVTFIGDGDKRQRIFVSNYTWFYFVRCKFRNFRFSDLQADTTSVFMYAGATTSAILAPGDSKHGRIVDCDFDGERLSMFGVRIYTEFQAANLNESINYDTQVIGGNYDQFMWNGVEIAGPNTISCGVDGATAYNSGLTPFDMDKGCRNCHVRNVDIDKLTGLPAPFDANTRPVAVSISGYSPESIFSQGNIAENINVKLYVGDLNSVLSNGTAIAAITSSKGDKIRNVNVTLNGTPTSVSQGKMGLAMLILEDTGGSKVETIHSTHASHGIIEQGVTLAAGSIAKNIIDDIACSNPIEGEAIGIAMNNAHQRSYLISGVKLQTTMGVPKFAEATGINWKSQSALAYLDVANSDILQSANFAINAQGSRLGIRDTFFRLPAGSHANFMRAVNTLTWLNLHNVRMNATPLYLDLALAGVTGSYKISSQARNSEFDRFESVVDGDLWVQETAPANPVVENWPLNQRLRKANYTTSTGYEFVRFGAAWRSVGALI